MDDGVVSRDTTVCLETERLSVLLDTTVVELEFSEVVND